MEMTRKGEVVLWVLQMVRGVDGQQRRRKWMSPFAFSMIWPFDEVFADFNQLNQRRIENDEVWALWDMIWLRIEGVMKICSFREKEARRGECGCAALLVYVAIYRR